MKDIKQGGSGARVTALVQKTNKRSQDFMREIAALHALAQHESPHFPRLVSAHWPTKQVTTAYCGEPLRTKDQCPSDWKEQLLGIEAQLKKHNIFHNDVHVDNLVVNKDNKLCLIDFGWATFDRPHEDKHINLTPSKIKNAKTCLDFPVE